jgi:hypothetical protein
MHLTWLPHACDPSLRRYTDLSGRPKHLYGVWQKLNKKKYTLDKICDVRGLRIIVESKEECYRAQRAVEVRAPGSVAQPGKRLLPQRPCLG